MINNRYIVHFKLHPFQEAALDGLKAANPDRRFWLKLDATDVKECVMESVKGVWNGDVDLGDGKLKELPSEYETTVQSFKLMQKARERRESEEALQKRLDELEVDRDFLVAGLNNAVEDYRKKYNNNSTSEQSLKNANWEVVEHQTLLQQAQSLSTKTVLASLNPTTCTNRLFLQATAIVKDLKVDQFLRDLFKKKRTAASHVLVFMLSDERRLRKPYAFPIRYIPYKTLKDQYVRDFGKVMKLKMKEKGLKLVGKFVLIIPKI